MGALKPRAKKILREAGSLAALILVTFLGRSSLADHYMVPTGSMLPTVQLHDHLIVDKAAYGLRIPLTGWYALEFRGPKHGDVVVLRSPQDGTVLLKRVVGVPGDLIEVHDGRLYYGGEAVPMETQGDETLEDLGDHHHEVSFLRGGGPDFGPMRIPEREYLVMGDNRGDSLDGRFFGLVKRGEILGKAEVVVFRHGRFAWSRL